MQVNGILNAQVGFALFDMYLAGVRKRQENCGVASPLINAAFKAFEGYLQTVETQHTALIAGTAIYALSPKGNAAIPVTTKDIAPFLALNILA